MAAVFCGRPVAHRRLVLLQIWIWPRTDGNAAVCVGQSRVAHCAVRSTGRLATRVSTASDVVARRISMSADAVVRCDIERAQSGQYLTLRCAQSSLLQFAFRNTAVELVDNDEFAVAVSSASARFCSTSFVCDNGRTQCRELLTLRRAQMVLFQRAFRNTAVELVDDDEYAVSVSFSCERSCLSNVGAGWIVC